MPPAGQWSRDSLEEANTEPVGAMPPLLGVVVAGWAGGGLQLSGAIKFQFICLPKQSQRM